MGAKKQYASPEVYVKKLEKVMDRLEVEEYDYNFDRHGCWVSFRHKGNLYRFDHSTEKARAHGVNLTWGSDAFAQVVLALEDLARMVERGIYELQTWVAGMRYLPPPVEVPSFFRYMGFTEIPESVAVVKDRYRSMAKQMHPDVGGDESDFAKLKDAAERGLAYFGERGGEYDT